MQECELNAYARELRELNILRREMRCKQTCRQLRGAAALGENGDRCATPRESICAGGSRKTSANNYCFHSTQRRLQAGKVPKWLKN